MAILNIFPVVPVGFEYLQYVVHSMFLIMSIKIVLEGLFDVIKSFSKMR